MISTVSRQGLINAFICGVVSLTALLVLTLFLSWSLAQSFTASVRPAISVLSGLTLLAFFGLWARERSARGKILLDCGPHPKRWIFLLCFLIFLLNGLRTATTSSFGKGGSGVGEIGFAVYWLILYSGRLQFSEQGIWHFWGLVRWQKIGSYRWADNSTLILSNRGLLSFLRGALPVPPEHKESVDDMLSRVCVPRDVI